MTTFVVTRHPGALAWAQAQGFGDFVHVPHLDLGQIRSGDTVLGTLPTHVAAKVCEKGAPYQHLVLDLPAEARGRDLSPEDMERYGARLEPLVVLPAAAAAAGRPERWGWARGFLRDIPRLGRAGAASILALVTWWVIQRGKGALDQIVGLGGDIVLNGSTTPETWVSLVAAVARGAAWAAMLAICIYAGFRIAKRIVRPIISRKLATPESGRRVVVLALSHAPDAFGPEFERLLATSNSLFTEPSRHNWIQPIRALSHHLQPGRTVRVHVLTSAESHGQVEAFGRLLEKAAFSRGARAELAVADRSPIDFADYVGVQDALVDLVEKLTAPGTGIRLRDICLESTSGTKITSIAMAVASLNHDLAFSYVSPNAPFATAIFDARLETIKISPS